MPKVIDHDERRRQIITVARQLMVEGGFGAATMRGIAAAAGFANGALKHYFDGKEAIVEATFDSVLQEMTEAMAALEEDDDAAANLRNYIRAALPLDAYRISGARVLLALWEYASTNAHLAERYREHLNFWGTQLGSRIAAVLGRAPGSNEVENLVHEIITVSIGANVASLLLPEETIISRYGDYADGVMARIAS